ncbi:Multiple EGF-like-domain protein 3 precursor [Minicystis rosea]|nr:Multiple EGF-like-domain protein 3 precursor [Minicystis rosea]
MPGTGGSGGGGGSVSSSGSTGGSGGSGGMTTSSSNTGGMNTGGMNTGGMNTGGMNTGGMNTGGMNTGGMNTGGMNTGGMNTGGMGTGGGTPCTDPTECPGVDDDCQARTCTAGQCGISYTDVDKPTPNGQTPSDCQILVCDGNGMAVNKLDTTDFLDDKNPCTIDVCLGTTPSNTASPMGTPCSVGAGTMCDGNGACVECLQNSDCVITGFCSKEHTCLSPTCGDSAQNGTETDVDCGGSCSPCKTDAACLVAADCESSVCSGTPLKCQAPSCSDTVKNGTESDLDCGGSCTKKCDPGQACTADTDCIGGKCSGSVCLATCTDQIKNGGESDVDCGGGTCPKCVVNKDCTAGTDCASGVCTSNKCQAPTCSDGVKNGTETDADCGGSCPVKCTPGQKCASATDCATGVCSGNPLTCQAPSCADLTKNGTETDVDCGGSCTTKCGLNKACGTGADCTSGVCTGNVCVAASCGDGVKSTGEGCDDHNKTNGDGCSSLCFVEAGFTCSGSPSVCVTTCGDGVKASTEGCDDHNKTNGDGCSATCTVETGFSCTGTVPSVCTSLCGDGIRVGTEGCDDHNTTNGDGCSSTCAVEAGFACTGSPSVCAPVCGDGQKKGAEACDDGNMVSGDGCSASCTVETGYTCTGVGAGSCTTTCGDGVRAASEGCDDGNTANGDGCTSTCAVELGYTCTGAGAGSCTTTCGDGVKAASEGCDDHNTAGGDGCSATCTIETGYTCTGNQPSACATTCGDGIQAGSEQCDDHNTASGDGCSASCTVENGFNCSGTQPTVCAAICGDGIKTPTEACDDGNLNVGDGCSAVCSVEPGYTCVGQGPGSCSAGCGDGVKTGTEACDDGNLNSGDGCSAACLIEPGYSCAGSPSACTTICGDGLVKGLEQCDDGSIAGGDGCAACVVEPGWFCVGAVCTPVCGDGQVLGTEACDDGNALSGDGCSATCGVEVGFTCSGSPSVCAGVCGDGLKRGTEGCDDGNTGNNDGCSAGCTVEPGFTCTGEGATSCHTVCGDGVKTSADACDDGNTTAGDGCSATCTVEAGFACTGLMPSVCGPICGDGQIKGTEQCDDGNTTAGDGCSAICQVEPGWEIEANSTIATANSFAAVSLSGKVNGRITVGDKDYFAVVVPAGTGATITAATINNWAGNVCGGTTASDSVVTIFNAAGVSLATNDDINSSTNWCSSISATFPAGTYYVEVKHHTSTSTLSYTLQVTQTKVATCGNGVLEASEQCDDSNTANGDGCSSNCQMESTPEVESNATCATANGPFTIPAGPSGRLFSGSLNPPGTTSGDQDWYAFTLTSTSDVKIQTFDSSGPGSCAPSTIDTQIALHASCPTTTALATNDTGGISPCSLIDSTATAAARHLPAGTYYVLVNGFGTTAFNYTLQIKLNASCGNGVVEGSETCDDGNTANGDGCDSNCLFEAIQEPATDTSSSCATGYGPYTLSAVGAKVLVGGNISVAADSDWFNFTLPAYADLKLETFDAFGPSTCATINPTFDLIAPDCTTVIKTQNGGGTGSCDKLDPATDATARHLAPGTYSVKVKAVSATATFGYRLQATLVSFCGNNVVEGSEICDGTPGCAADCTLIPACGNSAREAGEQCDDGNLTNGDGCSATCQWELTAEAEPNGTIAEADVALPVITGDRRITGAISPAADLDIYKLSVATQQVVRFEVFDTTGIDCASSIITSVMNLKLFNAGGTLVTQDTPSNDTASSIASGIGANCPALVYDLAPGTYYIQAAGAGAVAAYQLQIKFESSLGNEVEPNTTSATATAMPGNDMYVFGDHQTSADVDYFAITIPPGPARSIRAEIVEGDSSKSCDAKAIDSLLTLYNASGTSLVSDDDDGRGYCSAIDGTGASPRDSGARNLAPGTYYLEVKKSSSATAPADLFNYKLVVTIRQ